MSLVLVWLASGASALPLSPTEATGIFDYECSDIYYCRTIFGIVWSCLATIFACVWVAVHPNVPAPEPKYPFQPVVHRVAITVCALLVPEYVVAWSIRQWLVASHIIRDIEKAQKKREEDKERDPEVEPRGFHLITDALAKKFISNREQEWTVTHGFFVAMGGLYYFNDDEKPPKPIHPVSREDLQGLIKTKEFKLPSKAEINDKSKGDPLSKAIAIIQTLWFVLQCAARRLQSLPITKLELVTLAYTAITLAMYRFWWSKPLHVLQPIRVTCKPPLRAPPSRLPQTMRSTGWLEHVKSFMNAVVGVQDNYVDLRGEMQVPTFYAGKPDRHLILLADFIALLIALIFGAVHCIAWSFSFPSHAEQLLWRISSATIVVVPFIFIILVSLVTFKNQLLSKVAIVGVVLGIPCYIVARIGLQRRSQAAVALHRRLAQVLTSSLHHLQCCNSAFISDSGGKINYIFHDKRPGTAVKDNVRG